MKHDYKRDSQLENALYDHLSAVGPMDLRSIQQWADRAFDEIAAPTWRVQAALNAMEVDGRVKRATQRGSSESQSQLDSNPVYTAV